MILFVLGLIVYGCARATQQASLFIARQNRDYPEWIDESKEIHFYGWFEPAGIILASFGLTYNILYHNNYWLLLMWIPGYFIYWLPYALMYCWMRKKKWFNEGQYYLVWKIKTKLLSKKLSYIMFFVSIIIVIFWREIWIKIL